MVYNYEVSIFNELNGSNDYNGTAIACILILGAGGALAPVWMGVSKWDTQAAETSMLCDESHSHSESQSHWSPGGSEQAPWGGIPCREVERVEAGTSDIPLDHPSDSDHPPLDTVTETENKSPSLLLCPFNRSQCVSYHLSTSVTVLLIILGVLSALSLLLFLLSWSVLPSISMLALFFAAWQCITAVFFVQLAICLRSLVRRGASRLVSSRGEDSTFTIEREEDYEGAEMTHSVFVQNPLTVTVKRTARYVQLSGERDTATLPESANSGLHNNASCIRAPCELGSSIPSSATLSFPDASHGAVLHRADRDEEKEQEEVVANVSPPPANSLVFVAVVGCSALVQCTLQTVLFSWLECSLRVACSALVFFFILSTALFAVQVVRRLGPGPTTLLTSLLSKLSLTRQPQLFAELQQQEQHTHTNTHTAQSRMHLPSASDTTL